MPRTASTAQGSKSTITARRSHGLDVSWQRDALCAPHNRDENSPWYRAWHQESRRERVVMPDGTSISSAKLMDVALTFCQMCPVQWDCASYAVVAQETYLIWAMSNEDMRMLRKRADALILIERARNAGISVQVAIRPLRAAS